MCGRFVSASPPDELARYFGAELDEGDRLEPSFNVAPTNEVYAVRARDGVRQLAPLRWGLVPFWSKDLKTGSRMINARSETVATKPAFRKAYEQRRCLIPADGFYEWAKVEAAEGADGPKSKKPKKQPYFISRPDGEPIVFAGLWERWRPRLEDGKTIDDSADPIETCTILTCAPNAVMAEIHDRMPVLIPPRFWDDWLAPETDPELIAGLLRPAPDDLLSLVPVSTAVNNVRNKGEELVRPLPVDGLPGDRAEADEVDG